MAFDALHLETADIAGRSLAGACAPALADIRPPTMTALTLLAPGGFGAAINRDFVKGVARASRPDSPGPYGMMMFDKNIIMLQIVGGHVIGEQNRIPLFLITRGLRQMGDDAKLINDDFGAAAMASRAGPDLRAARMQKANGQGGRGARGGRTPEGHRMRQMVQSDEPDTTCGARSRLQTAWASTLPGLAKNASSCATRSTRCAAAPVVFRAPGCRRNGIAACPACGPISASNCRIGPLTLVFQPNFAAICQPAVTMIYVIHPRLAQPSDGRSAHRTGRLQPCNRLGCHRDRRRLR